MLPLTVISFLTWLCRNDRIRTCDFEVPNFAAYHLRTFREWFSRILHIPLLTGYFMKPLYFLGTLRLRHGFLGLFVVEPFGVFPQVSLGNLVT